MGTKCPKCETDNPVDSKFCKECATPFPGAGGVVPTKTIETPYPQFKPGTSLANRYEIISELGKGGMGEVYLAEDTNLKRRVAVKVLPQPFALDKERLDRFEREARLLASLNHPNIATIHGLEKSNGQQFLVMELVEGETLAEKLKKGPLPIDESLEVCRQIAEGLESAHEKGIIHRDLKPGNIMITPEGKAKILDLGLAKAFQEEPEAIDLSKSPTLTDQMTRPGVILGTAAYMSPEQARSLPVDKRTDIWAFGCVLYECLSGKMAFQGGTFSDILVQILKDEPDWTKLPSNIPTTIKVLLRRCLQKDPSNRIRDIGDARIEMNEARFLPAQETTDKKRSYLGQIFIFAAATILAGLLIYSLVIRPSKSDSPSLAIRSVIKLEPGFRLGNAYRPELTWPLRKAMAFSKDGSFIIYGAINDETGSDAHPQLFLRRLDKPEATPIPGTEGGNAPFLSPDNRWVGFWVYGILKKVPIEGGVPQDLAEYTQEFGASWGDDGEIILGRKWDKGLYSVSHQGGEPEIFTEPDHEREEFSHRLPSHLPDRKGVLFTIVSRGHDLEHSVAILDLKTRKWQLLLDDASDARYIPTGHIVFMRKATLMAVPFDLEKLAIKGQPVRVIPDVMHILNTRGSHNNTGAGQYSISESGSIVYVLGSILPDWKNLLVWVDHKGNEKPVSSHLKHYADPRLSPDGQKIIYQKFGTENGIGIFDIVRDVHTPIISEGFGGSPIWTPDGNRIVFNWLGSIPPKNIYMISSDRSSAMERLTNSQNEQWPVTISSDGNLLAFVEPTGIFIYDFQNKQITPLVTSAWDWYPDFSPNGRWIAYCANQEGQLEVYVRPSSGTGEIKKVSPEGGRSPLWARSGKQLFYRSLDAKQMWVVDISTETGLTRGKPRLLFEKERLSWNSMRRGYDISLDDQLFLMVKQEDRKPQPVTEMVLIQNWFEELKHLVPTGK